MFSPQKLEIFPLLQPLSQKLILTSPIAFPIPIVTAADDAGELCECDE